MVETPLERKIRFLKIAEGAKSRKAGKKGKSLSIAVEREQARLGTTGVPLQFEKGINVINDPNTTVRRFELDKRNRIINNRYVLNYQKYRGIMAKGHNHLPLDKIPPTPVRTDRYIQAIKNAYRSKSGFDEISKKLANLINEDRIGKGRPGQLKKGVAQRQAENQAQKEELARLRETVARQKIRLEDRQQAVKNLEKGDTRSVGASTGNLSESSISSLSGDRAELEDDATTITRGRPYRRGRETQEAVVVGDFQGKEGVVSREIATQHTPTPVEVVDMGLQATPTPQSRAEYARNVRSQKAREEREFLAEQQRMFEEAEKEKAKDEPKKITIKVPKRKKKKKLKVVKKLPDVEEETAGGAGEGTDEET